MLQNLKGSKCSYSSNSKHDVGNPAKADYLINVEVVLEIKEWCTVSTCQSLNLYFLQTDDVSDSSDCGRLKYGELKQNKVKLDYVLTHGRERRHTK